VLNKKGDARHKEFSEGRGRAGDFHTHSNLEGKLEEVGHQWDDKALSGKNNVISRVQQRQRKTDRGKKG